MSINYDLALTDHVPVSLTLNQSDFLLIKIELPKDASACYDVNCKIPQHGAELCSFDVNIVESLLVLSSSLSKTKTYKIKSGCKLRAEELHAEARRSFKAWAESGRKHPALYLTIGNTQMLNLSMLSVLLKGMKC